jgi:hypothetical protein
LLCLPGIEPRALGSASRSLLTAHDRVIRVPLLNRLFRGENLSKYNGTVNTAAQGQRINTSPHSLAGHGEGRCRFLDQGPTPAATKSRASIEMKCLLLINSFARDEATELLNFWALELTSPQRRLRMFLSSQK